MCKKIIYAFLTVLLVSVGFAGSMQTNLPMANFVKVKNATVENAVMGPFGQQDANKKQLSTEVKMDLMNNSNEKVKLVAATTNIAKKVQLHKIVKHDGKTMMKQIDDIKIKADSERDLSFHGIHIMLIGLKKPLVKGQEVSLTLIFSDGSYKHVNATVAS